MGPMSMLRQDSVGTSDPTIDTKLGPKKTSNAKWY